MANGQLAAADGGTDSDCPSLSGTAGLGLTVTVTVPARLRSCSDSLRLPHARQSRWLRLRVQRFRLGDTKVAGASASVACELRWTPSQAEPRSARLSVTECSTRRAVTSSLPVVTGSG
eukprot:3497595-Rhodomonas_salina.1